jgi:hypothetical protein
MSGTCGPPGRAGVGLEADAWLEGNMIVRHEPWSPQVIAWLIGILVLITIVAGGFGEAYVPSKMIVGSDPAATARNVLQSQSLFRLGFVGYIIEALCDATLTALLYLLLKPAGRELALIGVLFRIVATVAFASSESFYFAALSVLRGASYLKFSPDQLNSLALVSFKFSAIGGIVPTLFYGAGWMVFGFLIYGSGYLPKWLGALMAFAGACFVIGNVILVIAPAYSSDLFILPMMIGMLALAGWLFIRGVDVEEWRKSSASSRLGAESL